MIDYICISLSSIQDTTTLFDVIDQSLTSIYIKLSNGELKDLRQNLALQNYLTWMSPYNVISHIDLFLTHEEEAKRLVSLFS